MINVTLTFEDTQKLKRAYEVLDDQIRYIEEVYNKRTDANKKPSAAVVEAHKMIGEVLFGKKPIKS